MPTIQEPELVRFYTEVFHTLGLPLQESKMAAGVLVFADVRGVHTHGAANLGRVYLSRFRDGCINPAAKPYLVVQEGATALMDADRAVGLVSAQLAMDEAIGLARRLGVGVVAVRNSSHCGSLAYYTQQAVEQKMMGFAFTNTGRQRILPPPGGRRALLGTNVLAAAAPTGVQAPFSLDMSTAVVSTGKIRRAHRRGEVIPSGWLVDADGRSVLDAGAFLDGNAHLQFLGGSLETGGYKGYGLALLIDILCGILADGSVGPSTDGVGPSPSHDVGVGHLMIALDVSKFREAQAFCEALDEMLVAVLACPATDPNEPVSYPGRAEHEKSVEGGGRASLDDALLEDLADIALQLDIAPLTVADRSTSIGVKPWGT